MFATLSTILLVEDNPADVMLTREALDEVKLANALHVGGDGEAALAFLRQEGDHAHAPRPDIILLDLNLPRKDGREVLREIKSDDALSPIPVIVLTTSSQDEDVLSAYRNHVNAYVQKPVNLDSFIEIVKGIEGFWLAVVRLPPP